MKKFKMGIQSHSLRQFITEDPTAAFRRIKEMGYDGIEFALGLIKNDVMLERGMDAAYFRNLLDECGLECYGTLIDFGSVEPDRIQETLDYNKCLGSSFMVIGSAPAPYRQDMEGVNAALEIIHKAYERLTAEGYVTGYHNHKEDFFSVIEGKTFFEHVMDNTPQDFEMLIDTGNAKNGGYDTIPLIEKYPGRTHYLHIRASKQGSKGFAWIGEDDIDWKPLIECAVRLGGAKVFDIEFSNCGDRDPFERAKSGLDYISAILAELE